jgi:hypothetical protein
MPYICDEISRPLASAAAIPQAIPTTTSLSDSRITIPTNSTGR